MIYVIIYRGVNRGTTLGGWKGLAVAFVTCATAAGALAGAVLGVAGSLLSINARLPIGAVAALAAVVVALVELGRRRVPLLQYNHETRREWLFDRPILGAARTGAAIGLGFATRIGFWLWYIVPFFAFLSGSAAAGAAVYGSYALARTTIPTIISAHVARAAGDGDPSAHAVQDRMTNHISEVRVACSLLLLAVAVAFLV